MTSRYAALIVFGLAGALAAPAQAQSLARQRALDYLQRNAGRHGLTQADVTDLVVTGETTSRRSGVTHVYVRQQIGGGPVVAGAMTVNVAPDGRVLLASGELVAGLQLRAIRPGSAAAVSAEQAVAALAADAGLAPTEPFRVVRPALAPSETAVLSDGGLTRLPVRARLVYGDDGTGAFRLAWEATLYLRGGEADWYGLVDAATGEVLLRVDLLDRDTFGPAVASFAPVAPPVAASRLVPSGDPLAGLAAGGAGYRVFAAPYESPIHGPVVPPADGRALVSGVEDADASPFGWHDTNGAAGAEFTLARGNNVHAYADWDDDDAPAASEETEGGPSLQFDFPIDFTQDPSTYKDAAVTNLFYWSNVFHDVLHGYGFDEASGNFQANNYGRGGAGNDAVQAEAQNGRVQCNDPQLPTCTNNARFSTPPDGQPGRMEMFEWTRSTPRRDSDLENAIIIHEYTHGVSNRLTGGPATTSCLQNAEQMGEGWSDWYGLMMTMKPGDAGTSRRTLGTYVLNQPTTGPGVRLAPYSTAFTVNNYTYQRTRTLTTEHTVGFVWATALWEATWDMIAAHGFSPDLYDADGTAGNQIMLNLVTEGLKMQPCSPGFVDGRDAILAADEALYDGAHVDLLYAAFARRGLGVGASQGLPNSNADNTESFVVPEEVAPTAVTDLAAVPNGDYATLRFTATGDDGSVGTAATYRVRRSSTPILTDADFEAATPVAVTATPAAAGTPEAVVAEGLPFSTTVHFAIKVADENLNLSPLSNSASTTTLAAPTATVPSAPISVASTGEATATLTLSNAGPSDLRFSLDLAETTARPAPAPLAARATPAVEREDPEGDRTAKGDTDPAGAPQLRGSGGPDAFGYRWTDSNEPGGPVYAFTDISATGTAVTLADDASSSAISLPFPFPFYGTNQMVVRIGSNGVLSFGAPITSNVNTAIPNPSLPNRFVAPFWDDLDPGSGGTVKYQNMGDGRFIVQYTNVPRFDVGTGAVTVQVVLSQSGEILLQYQAVPTTRNEATVGIENATGTDGLQVVHNGAYLEAGLAVRIATLFVETDVTAGLIPAGQSRDVQLLFDATGLAAGTYTANLTVTTNSPNAPTTVIPLTLTVGTVDAAAGPLSFEGTHLLGAVYPNPAPGAARMDLAVAEAQTVRVELYDALGRRVGVVFDGPVAARTNVPVAVSPEGLAAGTYVVRVVGKTFSDARRLTVVR